MVRHALPSRDLRRAGSQPPECPLSDLDPDVNSAVITASSLRDWLTDRLPGPDDDKQRTLDLLEGLQGLDAPMTLSPADRDGAWRLYVELETRITTQPLQWRVGDERAALESLHHLFPTVRQLVQGLGPRARTAGELGIFVLNRYIRPLTSTWHGRLQRTGFLHDDDRRLFRLELRELRAKLVRLQPVFRALADPEGSDEERGGDGDEGVLEFFSPGQPLPPGRRSPLLSEMFVHEAAPIQARRVAFGLISQPEEGAPPPAELVGLGLSGGGIRSATFALGLLQALSRRDLYRHIDLLSTVSGGGYLGALISSWATGSQSDDDKRRGPFVCPDQPAAPGAPAASPTTPAVEPLAVRHVRNHSRTLTEDGWWHVLAPMAAGILASTAMFYLLCLSLAGGAFGCWWLVERAHVPWWVGLAVAAGAIALLPASQRLLPRQLQGLDAVVSGAAVSGVAFSALPAVLDAANALLDRTLAGLSFDYLTADMLAALLPALTTSIAMPLQRVAKLAPLRDGLLAISPVLATLLVVARLHQYLVAEHHLVLFAGLTGVAVVILLVTDVNKNSPHRFYRDRLARAWCVRPDANGKVQPAGLRMTELSEAQAPLHLVNMTANLDRALDPEIQRELRGRNADFFCASRLGLDSPTLASWRWQQAQAHPGRGPEDIHLATAMAISGAAVGPRLGVLTPTGAGAWLTLLNLRLGYWLHNPRRPAPRWLHPAWGGYLVREALGWLHEETPRINLSDGGHLENLGVFELLRRRCAFVIAIDGEADPDMSFGGLVKLKRYARIDLDCDLDLDVQDLKLGAHGFSDAHAALGSIRYHDDSEGRLLYIKLSVTGDEPAELLDYRRRSPAFPHESTADQVFGEEQFESYRRLGEHIGEHLCSTLMEVPDDEQLTPATWFRALEQSLVARRP